MARAVLADLPLVRHSQGNWHCQDDMLLNSAEAASFWKLHGYRNFLKSAALAAGEGTDRTKYLGRWQAESSDEYTRTSRQIITEIQNSVATKAAGKPNFLDESDTLTDLRATLLEAGLLEEGVAEQILKLKLQPAGGNDEAPFNVFVPLPVEDQLPESEEPAEVRAHLEQPSSEDEPEMAESIVEDYWVSDDKRGGKLHITGKCPSFPGQNVKNFEWAPTPGEVKWASLCKKCWKGVPGPDEQEAAEASASSSSSSSSSSEGGNGI